MADRVVAGEAEQLVALLEHDPEVLELVARLIGRLTQGRTRAPRRRAISVR